MCDDEWNIADGGVVCHQLGFSKASSIHEGAEFGPGMLTHVIYVDK